jgi:hypothetical protein
MQVKELQVSIAMNRLARPSTRPHTTYISTPLRRGMVGKEGRVERKMRDSGRF